MMYYFFQNWWLLGLREKGRIILKLRWDRGRRSIVDMVSAYGAKGRRIESRHRQSSFVNSTFYTPSREAFDEKKENRPWNEKRRMSALAPALRTPVYTHVSRKRVYSRKDEEKRRRFDGGGSNSGAVTRKEKMVRRSQEREFKSCMNSIKWSTPSMCKACNIVNNLLYKCLERKNKNCCIHNDAGSHWTNV